MPDIQITISEAITLEETTEISACMGIPTWKTHPEVYYISHMSMMMVSRTRSLNCQVYEFQMCGKELKSSTLKTNKEPRNKRNLR